jgi:hypothetical protein
MEPKKRKLNKSMAGYHILMILSAVDFRFHIKEELVIKEWIEQEFVLPINFDNELSIISALLPEQWQAHYTQCLHDYWDETSYNEKAAIVNFAEKLILADEILHKAENEFYKLLIRIWKEKTDLN